MGWVQEKWPARFGIIVDRSSDPTEEPGPGTKPRGAGFGAKRRPPNERHDRMRGRLQGLRRRHRQQRNHARGARGAHHRADRPQRVGQDNAFSIRLWAIIPIDSGIGSSFDGREISDDAGAGALPGWALLRTFQQSRIYTKMDCMSRTCCISMSPSRDAVLLKSIFAQKLSHRPWTERAEELAGSSLAFIREAATCKLGDLSFGQQKLLEFAMALMNEPKMLLLDEPTAGINPDPDQRLDRTFAEGGQSANLGITLVRH